MENILDEIYTNGLHIRECGSGNSAASSRAFHAVQSAEAKVRELIPEEHRKVLETLVEANANLMEESGKEDFRKGFALACRFMLALAVEMND